MPLHSRPTRASVRHIHVYVREANSLPADTEVNVPVRMYLLANWHTPNCEWVTEFRELRPDLLAAQMLLLNSDKYTAIHLVNISGVDQVLQRGHALGIEACNYEAIPFSRSSVHYAGVTSQPAHSDVFSKHEYDLDCTSLLTARVETGDHRPIAEPLRMHARVHESVINEAIDKMLKADMIQECSSPWATNLVIVPRTDSTGSPISPRVTADNRKLNNVTIMDKFSLQRIKDCLKAMEGSVYFSMLDMSSSFHQVPLDPRNQDKVAFITKRGQFSFKKLPQGSCNSPSTFCRLIALVLKGLT